MFRTTFERKNLVYSVRIAEDKPNVVLRLVEKIQGSGIIYVRSRKKARELALFLAKKKISSDYYHAGLSHPARNRKQYEWMKGNNRIMVSTNAFGMGIDKPDVRFVIHVDLPSSLEEYFQEAGRAGRDNKTANAILLYNTNDKSSSQKRIRMTFPEPEIIKQIHSRLEAINAEDPEALVVIDAALLVETGMYKIYDKLLVVSAQEETQVKRLMDRDRMSRDEAEKRIRSQLPQRDKMKIADFVIDNEGPLGHTREQVVKVFNTLSSLQSA